METINNPYDEYRNPITMFLVRRKNEKANSNRTQVTKALEEYN